MQSTIALLRNHISSITKYISPLLPLANCHMVEFITKNHWNLLPEPLRDYLEGQELNDAVEDFWQCHNNKEFKGELSFHDQTLHRKRKTITLAE